MKIILPNQEVVSKQEILEEINAMCPNTLMETLQIKFSDITEGSLSATMPVSSTVHQPMGILHGGASAALIETVGSAASYLFINREKQIAKGLEISVNHLKSVSEGLLTAIAKPIHVGRTTHIFEVEIFTEEGKKVTYGKMTNIVMDI
jgi:uncharacterized protein (TIGR00369 family)